jgi:hypothetical protein
MSALRLGSEHGWLRRNRWWLLSLPLALALALASAAYRVNDFWYENGWHHEIASVPQGRFVTTRHTVYSLDQKPKRVDLRVRLGAVGLSEDVRDRMGGDRPLPHDAVGVKVRLDFQAVAGKPAPYCEAFVVDTEGNRYPVEELDGGSNPCPPPGGSPDDPTAPRSWSRVVAAAVPKTARVEAVQVGVSWPGYLMFHLSDTEQRALADR